MVKSSKRKIDSTDSDPATLKSFKGPTSSNVIKDEEVLKKLGGNGDKRSLNLNDEFSSDSNFDESDQDDEPESEYEKTKEEKSESNNSNKYTEGKKTSSDKLPSTDELRELANTPKIFNSNLIKLEIEEMLNETRIVPQTTKTKNLEILLKKLTGFIQNTPEIPELPLKQAIQNLYTNFKSNKNKEHTQYKIPFLKPALDTSNFIVKYQPPLKIAVVGSYALGLAVKTRFGFNVDIAVQMPNDLFLEKDYLNFRYFHKRSYYLGCLLSFLKDNNDLSDSLNFEYDYLRGDERLPIIVCYNKKETKNSNDFCFRIIPCISPDLFSRDKLSPSRNHIRPNYLKNSWDSNKTQSHDDSSNSSLLNPPTPNYNSSLLSEIQYFSHMNFLHNLCKQSPGFKDAVILIKIWISQRGFGKRVTNFSLRNGDTERNGSVNGFLLTMMLAWLICGHRDTSSKDIPILSTGLSSFQMFKAFLSFLSVNLLSSSKPEFEFKNSSQDESLKSNFTLSKFSENFDHVFIDPSGYLNLMSRAREWELRRLKIEATNSLHILSSEEEKGFFSVFIDYVDNPLCVYDHLFKIELDNLKYHIDQLMYSNFSCEQSSSFTWEMLDEANLVSYLQKQIVKVISRGLGNRLTLIEARQPELLNHLTKSGEKTESSEENSSKKISFLLGLIVDKSEASKLVTLGPYPPAVSENSENSAVECINFENLWGNKSELRRFKDGTIRLSTVWGSGQSTITERSAIVPKMASFLMMRHFRISSPSGILNSQELSVLNCENKIPESAIFLKVLGKGYGGRLFIPGVFLNKFLQTSDEFKCQKNSMKIDSFFSSPKPFLDFETTQKYFIEWTKKVISLGDELPLQISSVRTTSAFLRGTSVTVPKQTFDNNDTYLYPIDAILEFESSTKWPDEILAIQKVKAAFLQKLGDIYSSKNKGSTFNVVSRSYGHSDSESNSHVLVSGTAPLSVGSEEGPENSGDLLSHEQDLFLEIFDSNYTGFIYRIALKLDREKFFYDRIIKQYKVSTPLIKEVTSKKSKISALSKRIRHWNRVYEWRPKHHYEVESFSKTHYPAFSITCRLFKRWLSSHFLLIESGQGYISPYGVHGIPEEVAELLVACVFSNKSYDYKVYLGSPSTISSAFARVLELVSNYKFSDFPLLVDLNIDLEDNGLILKSNDAVDWIEAIEYFNNSKKSKFFGGMYIMTPKDQKCEWFGHISALATNQIRRLASASLNVLYESIEKDDLNLICKIFISPTNGFDFKLVLDPEFCTRINQSIAPEAFKRNQMQYLKSSDFTASKGKDIDRKSFQKKSISGSKSDNLDEFKNIELAKKDSDENHDGDNYESKPDNILEIASMNTDSNPFGDEKMVDFDPVSKLKSELDLIYDKSAVFFYDTYGGNTIYGLWNPSILKTVSNPIKFKANLGMNTIPSNNENQVSLNTEAILCEILNLGEDLINEVNVK
ncbi:Nucleolar protein 6 [Smittium mucronatum]|uniref:Nucleolar protein 6 n=1 Tax=Smittium mucronatum TaxID=133383 RepID=A0A1R0GQF9_9FUNG|nr:Nucleolar protein 6 [Smittium mucronatum]